MPQEREELATATLTWLEDQLFFFFYNNHPLSAPTSKVPVFLKRGKSWREQQDGSCWGGPRDAVAIVVIVCHLLSRAGNRKVLLAPCQRTTSEAMTDSSTGAEGAARLCPLLLVEGCLTSSRLSGAHSWEQLEGQGGDGGQGVHEEFSFQADGKEQGEVVPASLMRGNTKSLFIPTRVWA